MEISQNTKNRAAIQPGNSTVGHIYMTKTLIQKDILTPVFIVFVVVCNSL